MQAFAAGAFGGDLGLIDPLEAGLAVGSIHDDAGYALAGVTAGGGGGLATGVVALAGGVDAALTGNGFAGLPVGVAVFGFGVVGICLGGGFANCVVALAGGVDAAVAGNGVAGLPVGAALSGFGVVGMAVDLDLAGTTLVVLVVDAAVAATGAGLAVDVAGTSVGLAADVAGTGSVASLVGGCTSICLGGCTATVVGVSSCCGELALAFFFNLGVPVLLAGVTGLGGVFALGLGIGEAGAGMVVASGARFGCGWIVSGDELGASAVPPGKGTANGMLSGLGAVGLGGMGGWSGLLGSVEPPWSCMACSNFWMP